MNCHHHFYYGTSPESLFFSFSSPQWILPSLFTFAVLFFAFNLQMTHMHHLRSLSGEGWIGFTASKIGFDTYMHIWCVAVIAMAVMDLSVFSHIYCLIVTNRVQHPARFKLIIAWCVSVYSIKCTLCTSSALFATSGSLHLDCKQDSIANRTEQHQSVDCVRVKVNTSTDCNCSPETISNNFISQHSELFYRLWLQLKTSRTFLHSLRLRRREQSVFNRQERISPEVLFISIIYRSLVSILFATSMSTTLKFDTFLALLTFSISLSSVEGSRRCSLAFQSFFNTKI